MIIQYCTGNKGKLMEMEQMFQEYKGLEILPHKQSFDEFQELNMKKILLHKASQVPATDKPILIDDTGVFFERYPNFPGTITKFVWDMVGVEGVKDMLSENNNAYFKTMLLYQAPGEEPQFFEGILKGKVVIKELMTDTKCSFPFSEVFIPDGYQVNLAQCMKDKSFMNHRKRSAAKLIEYLVHSNQLV